MKLYARVGAVQGYGGGMLRYPGGTKPGGDLVHDSKGELEARLASLGEEVADLRRRVAALEELVGEVETAPQQVAAAAAEAEGEQVLPRPLMAVTLLGRTLVVLGGAFLLRAATDAGTLPRAAGVAAGLVYALVWLIAADRAGRRGERLNAMFHGLAEVLVVFPLVWEAVARFTAVPNAVAAASLLVVTVATLAVAVRQRLATLAWLVVLGVAVTLVGLVVTTHDVLPFAVAAVMLAVVGEVLAARDTWPDLSWPMAATADLVVLVGVLAATRVGGPPPDYAPLPLLPLLAVTLGLAGSALLGTGLRTLRRGRGIELYDVLQCGAALVIGVGGAARLLTAGGHSDVSMGVLLLAVGAACYVATFGVFARREGAGVTMAVYSVTAVLLVATGCATLAHGSRLAILLALLAVTAAAARVLRDLPGLGAHAAFLLVVAASASGLTVATTHRLVGDVHRTWQPLGPVALLVAAAAVACAALVVLPNRAGQWTWVRRVPGAVLAALAVWAVAALAVSVLTPLVAGDAAALAVIRTLVLVSAAVLCGWAGGRWRRRELGWLVYPLLLGGGAKLVVEDLRRGRPLTLFFSLALFGVALVVAPRLLRQRGRGAKASEKGR